VIVFCHDEEQSFWESQFLGNGDPVLMRFRRAIVMAQCDRQKGIFFNFSIIIFDTPIL
jgi:hypothetical protein